MILVRALFGHYPFITPLALFRDDESERRRERERERERGGEGEREMDRGQAMPRTLVERSLDWKTTRVREIEPEQFCYTVYHTP